MMDQLHLSRGRRIDWRRVLENLRTTGMSLQDVADWLDVGKSTLQGYINEDLPSEPQHWIGHCLVVLWSERCGTKPEDVPTIAVDPRPKRELVRIAVMHNERVTSSLEQMAFAWFGAHFCESPHEGEVASVEALTGGIRFRVGIAHTPWDARRVSAFVVYDESAERRVQGSREFIKWCGDWHEFLPGESPQRELVTG